MRELLGHEVSTEGIGRHLIFVESLEREMKGRLGLFEERQSTCLPVLFRYLMNHYGIGDYESEVCWVDSNGDKHPWELSDPNDENKENYVLRFVFGNEKRKLNLYFQEREGISYFEVNGPVNGRDSQVGRVISAKTLDSIFGRLSNEIEIFQNSGRDLIPKIPSI